MGDQRTSSLYQISPALIIPKYLLLRELVQSAIFPTNGGHWIQKNLETMIAALAMSHLLVFICCFVCHLN